MLVTAAGTSRRTLLLSVLALPWAMPDGCGRNAAEPDTRALERMMAGYVGALNRKDTAELSRLLGSNHNEAQIAVRVERFGGRALHHVRISHQRESAQLHVVFVNALAGAANRPFEAREIAAWKQNRWTLTPWPRELVRPTAPAQPGTGRAG